MRTAFLLLFSGILSAQVTLRVTSIPSNTPVDATIYFAGSVNSWDPGNTTYTLVPDGLGNRTITIPEGTGTVEYKFTRGSWPTVEGNASGGFLPNRSFTFTGSPQTINLTIQSWEDLGGSGSTSTAASNVQILDNAFAIPQLGRTRRVWLYLPPDYSTSAKHYPVLYMQDGQNLFDNATSFAGEWQVDETLNSLFAAGDYGAIVVGIDNGGGERLNEYSPWVNPSYGGGQGDEYMAFIANTLKPYIDANYRTRAQPAYNALIGSSMGALISTYGICEYPEAFAKCGAISPAYWFALSDMQDYITTQSAALDAARAYFICGSNESSSMVGDMGTIRNALQSHGLTTGNTNFQSVPGGTHSETWWRTIFGGVYQWLFADESLAVNSVQKDAPKIIQMVTGKIYASGFDHAKTFNIVSSLGQRVGSITIDNGVCSLPETLASGLYFLQSDSNVIKPVRVAKFR